MSTLKTNTVQLGNSADPTKNFTLKVPATPDGTLEVWTGNAEAPLSMVSKVDANGIQNIDSAHKLYTPQNIVGTMAGGSIIERGSNANGQYIKFADGTMVCTHSVVGIARETVGYTAIYVWNYPAAFSSAPTYYAAPTIAGSSPVTPLIYPSTSHSSASIRWYVFGSGQDIPVGGVAQKAALSAIGRWF